MTKAYRITMDYNEFNFEDLKEEYKDKKTSTWYIKRKETPKIKDDFEVFGKMDAYIYCSNMPDKLNRFVFKGIITDVSENKSNDKWKDYNYKIVISDIHAYSIDDASKLAIRNGNGINFSPQGTYGKLDETVLNKLSKIDAKETLETFLDNYTGCECELKNFLNNQLSHSKFRKNNNDYYVEFHHLIFRNFGYDDNDLLKILDTTNCNYAKLCPSCHRAIHYGNNELKKQMLDELIKHKKKELEELYNYCLEKETFRKKVKNYETKNFKEFIYKIYGID